MKKIITFLFFTAISSSVFSQGALFQRTFGNSGEERGVDVLQTYDKGFITLNTSGNQTQVYLVRTDSMGTKLWSRTFATGYSSFLSIATTKDSGFVVCGSTGSSPTGYILKLDKTGNVMWTKSYANTSRLDHVQQSFDGNGYIACGVRGTNNPAIIRTDLSGTLTWGCDVTPPSFLHTLSKSLVELRADSSIYFSFSYASGGTGSNVVLSRVSKQGQLMSSWEITTSNLGNQNLSTGHVRETWNGHLLMNIASDLIEFDTAGTPLRNIRYPLLADNWDFVDPNSNKGLYSLNGYLTRFDTAGNIMWSHTVGGVKYDVLNGFTVCSNGDLVAIGNTASFSIGKNDVYLVRMDSSGTLSCNSKAGGTGTPSYPTAFANQVTFSFNTINYLSGPISLSSFAPADTTNDACGCVPPKAIFDTGYPSQNPGTIQDYSTWGTHWVWDYGNGVIDTSVYPSVQYTANGTYTICVKVSNACGADSVCQLINYVYWPIGISSKTADNTLRIYPNPAGSQIVLSSDSEIGMISICDVLGATHLSFASSNSSETIDMSRLAPGIYFVRTSRGCYRILKE